MQRREVLFGIATTAGLWLAGRPALAQSRTLQALIDDAASRKVPALLPAGRLSASRLRIPEGARLIGNAHGTTLVSAGGGPLLVAQNIRSFSMEQLTLDGAGAAGRDGLLLMRNAEDADISLCSFVNSAGDGINAERSGGRIMNCTVNGARRFGIFAVESLGFTISGNTVSKCGDGGIIIHRWSQGLDGSNIIRNTISDIRADSGGTGQWGNGINLYLTDTVAVEDNIIDGCAFSAVRANTARQFSVAGNRCTNSGETAIYAEFGFRDATITQNIIDNAANGISATNMDRGGRGALIQSNIIRNIADRGPYIADPPGFGTGISVEADAQVIANSLENIARFGINAGWGPFLDNVDLAANTINNARIGIGVSIAEGAGMAAIIANRINAREGAIRGHRWSELSPADYASDPSSAPATVRLEANIVD